MLVTLLSGCPSEDDGIHRLGLAVMHNAISGYTTIWSGLIPGTQRYAITVNVLGTDDSNDSYCGGEFDWFNDAMTECLEMWQL